MSGTLPSALYRAAQVRELDRLAIEQFAIPGLCLMERAGAAVFACLRENWPETRSLAVACGLGNNAGDGYVVARLAHLAGYQTRVMQVGDSRKLKGDALRAWENMRAVGVEPQPFSPSLLEESEVAVDALFGTGLDRTVEGPWREAIGALAAFPGPVVAVDIPSGLHADSGNILGCAARADATVTFIGLKQGLFTGRGPDCRGKLYFASLEVPDNIYLEVPPTAERLDVDCLAGYLPPRRRGAHKGDCGHALIIGGERGFIGAAILAAEGALRAGAGKVSLATRVEHAPLLSLSRPEIMSHGVESAEALRDKAAAADVIALGPGLGRGEWGRAMFRAVAELDKPLVVDADGLNLLADPAEPGLSPTVITPHPGEAGRLLGLSSAEVEADRFAAVAALRRRFGGVCLLKGAGSLIADGQGIALCDAGNPGMATGGMGDLLTGIIAALLAQGLPPDRATRAGVCAHAAAADRAAARGGERGLLPGDVLPCLREVVNPGNDSSNHENPP